jgi:hypothetical protein
MIHSQEKQAQNAIGAFAIAIANEAGPRWAAIDQLRQSQPNRLAVDDTPSTWQGKAAETRSWSR